MEDTLVFVDDGFFGLVKKHFSKRDGRSKKYLQTFRNVCKKEGLNLKHLYVYTAPPYQGPKPTEREMFLMSRYQNMVKMLRKKKWITLREGRCQKVINEKGEVDYSQKGVDALVILDMCDIWRTALIVLDHSGSSPSDNCGEGITRLPQLSINENYPHVKKIILIASDSDFVPVIERMKQKGFDVVVYTYFDRKRHSRFSTSNHLLKVASRWVKLTSEDFS